METTTPPYQRLWLRLGLPEVWGWPLLWFTVVVTGLASYAFDAVRLNNYSLNWLPINVLTLACAFTYAYGLIVATRGLDITQSVRAGVNVLIASTAMGFKNLFTFLLCGYFGIADTGIPIVRFFGGVSIGVCLLLIYSNLRGSKIERDVIQRELQEKEDALIGFRENAPIMFDEEEQELIRRSSGELLPRFLQLQEQVEIGEDVRKLSKKLEELLTNEVRPLSSSLAAEAKSLRQRIPAKSMKVVSDSNVKFNLGSTIRATSTTLLCGFAWAMLASIILPEATIFDLGICSVLYFAVLLVFKGLASLVKKATVNQALIFLTFPGFVASLIPYFLLMQIPHQEKFDNLMGVFLITGGLASIALGVAIVLDVGRNESEIRLKALVNSFSRENKLFEQKLWVAQRDWYTLLHGTVQSALTAAMIRSSNKQELTKTDKEAILADLNRAIKVLKDPVREEVKITEGLAAIQETWSGIATIDFKVEEATLSKIGQSSDSSLVVNEILKEAVSNAVKHGSATEIKVVLELDENGVAIMVANNGTKPANKKRTGVGSNLFDILCIEHSLTRNQSTAETEFRANVPLA
jgi:signal transduction histidine kinase